MKLTPIDIKKQEFKKSLRGYDPVEVETYLEYVADEYEKLLQANQMLEKQVVTLQTELRHYKDVEKTLKQTLHEVQQTSQISKQTSQKEAELIKREAEIQAAKMIDQARVEVSKLQKEINDLKQKKDSFITRLRYLLSSQLELLEILEADDDQLEKFKEKTKRWFGGSKRPNTAAPTRVKSRKAEEPEIEIRAPEREKKVPAPKTKTKSANADSVKKESPDAKQTDFFKDIFGDDLDVDDYLK